MTATQITFNYLYSIVPNLDSQFEDSITNVSGAVITGSVLSLIPPPSKTSDEDSFTPRELLEIKRSLIDLQTGNFKSFKNTEELFADLDSE